MASLASPTSPAEKQVQGLESFLNIFADAIVEKVIARLGSTQIAPRRLLDVRESAKYLGRTEDAVYQLINRGKLPVIRDGRRVHLDIADLDAFIQQNRVQ